MLRFHRRLPFVLFGRRRAAGVVDACGRRRCASPPPGPCGRRSAGRASSRGRSRLSSRRRCSPSCPATSQKLYVDIGDRVEADQLLVDLFLPELKDELRQKEAAVVQAQAEIELAAAAVRARRGRRGDRPGQRQLRPRPETSAPRRMSRAGNRSTRGSANWWPAARWTANSKTKRATRSRPRRRPWRGPREGRSRQGHAAAKPGRIGEGQGQRSRGPRPPRKRGSRPVAGKSRCCSTRKSAPRMPES